MPAAGTVRATGNGTDPAALRGLGERLRLMRQDRGMTQEAVAGALNCDRSAVSRIEAGTYPLTPQMQRAVDRVLSLAAAGGHETWFMSYLTIEQEATVLRTWQLVIPGLLQTEAYAWQILSGANPGEAKSGIEQRVAARLARQQIWQRSDPLPPMLFAILGEAALRRQFGGAQVMREQLQRLLAEAEENPRVSIQVLPFDSPGGAGTLAPFVLASFAPEPRPDVAYLENALDGATTDSREQVARLSLLHDVLAREALRPRESADLIRRVIGE